MLQLGKDVTKEFLLTDFVSEEQSYFSANVNTSINVSMREIYIWWDKDAYQKEKMSFTSIETEEFSIPWPLICLPSILYKQRSMTM